MMVLAMKAIHPRTVSSVGCLVLLMLTKPAPLRADTGIESWSLGTGVTDYTLPPANDTDARANNTAVSPFHESQLTRLPLKGVAIHTASTYFDAMWYLDTGHFGLSFDQQINGPDSFAATNGTIYFSSDVDILMNLSGGITFSSAAADEADFYCALSVRPPGPPPNQLWGGFVRGGTGSFGLPASGSGSFGRTDLLLPAGTTYTIRYTAETEMISLFQQPHQPLLASGTIHFDWRPVPEPASSLLLAFAAFALGTCRSPARRWIRDS